MGSARKVAKQTKIKEPKVGGTLGDIGRKLSSDQVKKGLDSMTGATSKRHAKETTDSKLKEAEAKGISVSEQARETAKEATEKRTGLEGKSRDVSAVESERIARGDVRDVTTSKLTGAGVQAAGTEAARIATGPQDQVRQTQQTLGAQLAATAAGQGMTPAQIQLKQSTDRNIAQQAAMRAGATGAGAALARREIGRTGAQAAQQAAQQGALLRAQETTAAQQQLGQLSGQMRGQDIGLATSQAGLEQQALSQTSAQQQQAFLQSSAQEQQAMLATAEQSLKAQLANQGVDLSVLKDNAARGDAASAANMQSQLQQLGMNDAMIQAYMQQELGAAGIQANIATGQASAAAAQAAAQTAASGQQQAGMLGAIGTIGAAALPILAASDVNLKTNVKDGKKSIGEFLSSLASYDYDYKDDKFGKGNQTSVMAQDLEKTETGKKAIIDTDEGKMVDYAKLLPAMLAGLSDTHKEVMDLKEALKKKKERK